MTGLSLNCSVDYVPRVKQLLEDSRRFDAVMEERAFVSR